jgi:hypothetical protein
MKSELPTQDPMTALEIEEAEARAKLEEAQAKITELELRKRHALELDALKGEREQEEREDARREALIAEAIALDAENALRVKELKAAITTLDIALVRAIKAARDVGPGWIRAYKQFAFKIVPEICGASLPMINGNQDPRAVALVEEFAARDLKFEALRAAWPAMPHTHALQTDIQVIAPTRGAELVMHGAHVPLDGSAPQPMPVVHIAEAVLKDDKR